MHKCWYCNNQLSPVYHSLASVFIKGLGYMVQGGGPVMWVCTFKPCRNYMITNR